MVNSGNLLLVEARGLSKSYPKVFYRQDRLRALWALLTGRSSIDSTRVLGSVDLDVRRGQSLGVIGENGAGKSTLLKLLCGVLTPTMGSVRVHGRIGALLELGAGFHPEYSGRDNIEMAAALYGLGADEVRAKLPEIIAFADIGEYIDEPVKHYSSGMVVRLGFSVIAAIKPDLLITDEVLAVGDESFQKKCVAWIENYVSEGGTLILVSHSMYHIQKLCGQACWLNQGEIAAYGDVFEVTQAYLAYHERKSAPRTSERTAAALHGVEFYLLEVRLNDACSDEALLLDQGKTLRVHVRIHSREGRAPTAMFGVLRSDGTSVYGVSSEMDGVVMVRESENMYVMEIEFPQLPLLPGSYVIKAHALDPEGLRLFDTIEREVIVRGSSREYGLVRLTHLWGTGVLSASSAQQ